MNLKYKILKVVFFSSFLLLFTGCATSYSNASVTVEPTASDVFGDVENTRESIEHKKRDKFIKVKNKSVSSVLTELSTNKTHILVGKDIILKKSNYKITTIGELKKYVKMFTDYKLIRLNEKMDLVEWKLVNLKINKFTKEITQIDLDGEVVINDVLLDLGKSLNYNILINNDIKEELQKKTKINYSGNSAEEFLNYIQNYMNLYYKIDKISKNINFFKYKETTYDLHSLFSDRNMYINTAKKNDKIKSLIDIKVNQYEDINQYLTTLVKGKNTFHIQKSTGSIYIKSDYLTNKSVEKILEEYKENLNKHINIVISKQELLMTDEEYSSFSLNFLKKNRTLRNKINHKEKLALSLVNSIPIYNDNSISQYIKTSKGMEEINYGTKIIVNAKTFIHDDRIIVEIMDDSTNLIEITKDSNDNQYPSIKSHSYNATLNMRSGEQRIIDSRVLNRNVEGTNNNLIEFTVVKIIK